MLRLYERANWPPIVRAVLNGAFDGGAREPRFYRQEEKQLGVFQPRGQKVRARALAANIANRRQRFQFPNVLGLWVRSRKQPERVGCAWSEAVEM
jgi:hypothetical protein